MINQKFCGQTINMMLLMRWDNYLRSVGGYLGSILGDDTCIEEHEYAQHYCKCDEYASSNPKSMDCIIVSRSISWIAWLTFYHCLSLLFSVKSSLVLVFLKEIIFLTIKL